jgi:hypothetical protein
MLSSVKRPDLRFVMFACLALLYCAPVDRVSPNADYLPKSAGAHFPVLKLICYKRDIRYSTSNLSFSTLRLCHFRR